MFIATQPPTALFVLALCTGLHHVPQLGNASATHTRTLQFPIRQHLCDLCLLVLSLFHAGFDRVLQLGDASATQSHLSFGGFGTMLRHSSTQHTLWCCCTRIM
jgi:hypothetical protein